MLTSQQVVDSPYLGWTDLVGEWTVLKFWEESDGRRVTCSCYDSARAAIRDAQWTRASENPRSDLAVYCDQCHKRCSYLFGYVCGECFADVEGAYTS